MSKRNTLAFTAALLMAGGAFAQAPVNTTTTPPQPTATEQGQPRPGQFNPAGPACPARRPRLIRHTASTSKPRHGGAFSWAQHCGARAVQRRWRVPSAHGGEVCRVRCAGSGVAG